VRVNHFHSSQTVFFCAQYATINVVSLLGHEQNIQRDVERWNLDADGVQRAVARRNPDQRDAIIRTDPSVTESLETLHENGVDAVTLDPESLRYALEDYEFVFVNFYASWYVACFQR